MWKNIKLARFYTNQIVEDSNLNSNLTLRFLSGLAENTDNTTLQKFVYKQHYHVKYSLFVIF